MPDPWPPPDDDLGHREVVRIVVELAPYANDPDNAKLFVAESLMDEGKATWIEHGSFSVPAKIIGLHESPLKAGDPCPTCGTDLIDDLAHRPPLVFCINEWSHG